MDSGRKRIPTMLHLSSERLAELADSEPTLAEAEHLAACATCATERSAHQRVLTLASDERDRLAPPLTDWATLSARLRQEEIILTPATAASDVVPLVTPRPHRRAWLAGLRVAAGLVLAIGFGALGRLTAGASALPSPREIASIGDKLINPNVRLAILEVESNSSFDTVEEALASLEVDHETLGALVGSVVFRFRGARGCLR